MAIPPALGRVLSVETAVELLNAVNLAALAVALPLSVIAAHGYRGTPWGRVLFPLPAVTFAFLVWAMANTVSIPEATVASVAAVTWGIGTVGIVVAAVRAFRVLTGRRAI